MSFSSESFFQTKNLPIPLIYRLPRLVPASNPPQCGLEVRTAKLLSHQHFVLLPNMTERSGLRGNPRAEVVAGRARFTSARTEDRFSDFLLNGGLNKWNEIPSTVCFCFGWELLDEDFPSSQPWVSVVSLWKSPFFLLSECRENKSTVGASTRPIGQSYNCRHYNQDNVFFPLSKQCLVRMAFLRSDVVNIHDQVCFNNNTWNFCLRENQTVLKHIFILIFPWCTDEKKCDQTVVMCNSLLTTADDCDITSTVL